MRPLLFWLTALGLAHPAEAQRRFRLGPTASVIALDEGSATETFTSFGGTLALLSNAGAETGITIARYDDLSTTDCQRSLTFFGLDSRYYPVGADGVVAPFASTELGLARVTDEDPDLLFGTCLPAEPSNEIGLGFGLGLRVNVGQEIVGMVEGRFFQVPNSAIQALEARANLSVAFGKPRESEFLAGTLGPAVSLLVPVSGALEGRGPFLGVRFRRDSRKAGTVGLQIDYAPMRITASCPADCEPYAILFAPGYESSLYPRWGRLYGALGVLIAGFPAQGADRGITQGAHGGVGLDTFASERIMVNLNARLIWLQRNGGENVFGVQLGASVSPKLVHPKAGEAPRTVPR